MVLRDLAVNLPAPMFWGPLMLVMAGGAVAFAHGVRLLRRAAVVANTPTSLIRSAAQGFVEFEGKGALLPGPPIVTPLTGTPCLWYRIKVVERSADGKSIEVISEETSDGLFLLRDSSGECAVDPEGAHITPNAALTWWSDGLLTGLPPAMSSHWAATGRYRFTEERLELGSRLYVMGHFSTHGGSQEAPNTPDEVRSQLNQWKRDYPALLRRFDANGDGQLDTQEWETVRMAAADEVRRQQRERFGSRTVNLISRPTDGREFVISTMDQERLVQRWWRLAGLTFSGFVAAAALIGWALVTRYAL